MEKQFLLFMFSKSLGGLKEGFEAKKGRRRRSRRRGCMGELVLLPCERSSIVPGTFSVASPRSLLSYPSPLPICKHIHIERDTHTHTGFVHLHVFSVSSFTLFCHTLLSHLCLNWFSLTLCLTTLSPSFSPSDTFSTSLLSVFSPSFTLVSPSLPLFHSLSFASAFPFFSPIHPLPCSPSLFRLIDVIVIPARQ